MNFAEYQLNVVDQKQESINYYIFDRVNENQTEVPSKNKIFSSLTCQPNKSTNIEQ